MNLGESVERIFINFNGKAQDLLLLNVLAKHRKRTVGETVSSERMFIVIVNGPDAGLRLGVFAACAEVLRRTTGMRISVHLGDTVCEDASRGMAWDDIVSNAAPRWGWGTVVVHTSETSSLPVRIVLAEIAEDYGESTARNTVGVVITSDAQPLCTHSARPIPSKFIVVVDAKNLCGDGETVDVHGHGSLFDDVIWRLPAITLSAFRWLAILDNVDAVYTGVRAYHNLLVEKDKKKKAAAVAEIIESLLSVRASVVTNLTNLPSGATGGSPHCHTAIPSTGEAYALYMAFTKKYSCADFPTKSAVDDIFPRIDSAFHRGSSTAYGIVAAILDPEHTTYTAGVCRTVKNSDLEIETELVGENDQHLVHEVTSDKSDSDIACAHAKDLAACVASLFGGKEQ